MMTDTNEKISCGIVMPISETDGCDELHWAEVLEIITASIEIAGFAGDLVSNADDVGIIHKRIIQNLYDNPIVVCDVSGKNPNVMFELGLRLAFDKPTIIVKDDHTAYSFDTAAIEHLEYPRDLRFGKVVEFKKKLAAKLRATHEKSRNDPEFTTFLKHFGEFKVAKLEKKEVSGQEYIIDELKWLRRSISRLERTNMPSRRPQVMDFELDQEYPDSDFNMCMDQSSESKVAELKARLRRRSDVRRLITEDRGDHVHILFDVMPEADLEAIVDLTKKYGAQPRRGRITALRTKSGKKAADGEKPAK